MFLGEYQHTLDAKGRVSLPAKFRLLMAGKIVLVKGIDRCIYVYELEEYEHFVADLMARSDFNAKVRQLRSHFVGGAFETELDSAGRVSLPAHLRDYAEISKEIAVVGDGKKIQMWSSETWQAYQASASESIDDIAQELADAGLL